MINDFFRSVADRIHLLNPQHLVFCFKLLRHTLTLCELPYQPIKHILCLLVDIGKISGQLSFGQQICVEYLTVTLQVAEMSLSENPDFHLRLFRQFQIGKKIVALLCVNVIMEKHRKDIHFCRNTNVFEY